MLTTFRDLWQRAATVHIFPGQEESLLWARGYGDDCWWYKERGQRSYYRCDVSLVRLLVKKWHVVDFGLETSHPGRRTSAAEGALAHLQRWCPRISPAAVFLFPQAETVFLA